jgi:hypothetical protein
MISMRAALISTVSASVLLSGLSGNARAGLLVPTSSSDVIVNSPSNPNDDSTVGPFSLPFNFSYFGNSFNQVFLHADGDIQFVLPAHSPSTQYFPSPLPYAESPGRVAVLWQDTFVGAGGGPGNDLRYNATVPGQFSVIWDNVAAYGNNSLRQTMEVVLLGAGNAFGAPDGTIVFSYGDIGGTNGGGNAGVGLNEGDGVHDATLAAVLGTNANGLMSQSQVLSLLQNNTFYFTPDGSGGYTAFAGAPIAPADASAPEPASLLTLGLGTLGLMVYLRRRQAAAGADATS